MKGSITAVICLVAAATLSISTDRTASADTTADKSRTVTTDDGWQVRITKTNETLDRVSNLAASPFTREGFVSLKAISDISGHGRVPVNSGSLTVGYQVGCQIDVSNGLSAGLSGVFGPNFSILAAPNRGNTAGANTSSAPDPSASPNAGNSISPTTPSMSSPPNVAITVGGSALAIPGVSVSPKPGTISTIPFMTKMLAGGHATITTEQVQIKVDSCAGPVSLRSYAVVSTSTATADNSVAVYGDPISL